MNRSNPWRLLACVAQSQLDVRETLGSNDGEAIRSYWRTCGWPGWQSRAPWCAAFTAWCVEAASECDLRLKLSEPPRYSGVLAWESWLQRNATKIRMSEADAGCIVTWTLEAHKFSHIAIVERECGFGVETIEGNTSDYDGGPGGVYRKVRHTGHVWRLPCRALIPAAEVASGIVSRS